MGKVIDLPFKKIIQNWSQPMTVEYRDFLELKILKGEITGVYNRLTQDNFKAAIENLVDRVIQEDPEGKKDKEFHAWLGGTYNGGNQND